MAMARSQSWMLSAVVLLVGWMAALASLPLLAAATAATPEAVDLNEQYLQLSNTSLRWMQRPNLYFGMRARVQGDSPLFGLMWYGMTDYQGYTKVRHSCEQSDSLTAYNWLEHDGRTSGVQLIKDAENNVQLRIEFLKSPVSGGNGGSWAARLSGEPLDRSRPSRISIITYYGLEGLGSLDVTSHKEDDEEGIDGPFVLSGNVPSLGAFQFRQEELSTSGPVSRHRHADDFGSLIDRHSFLALNVPMGNAWRAKDAIMGEAVRGAQAKMGKYGQDSAPDPAVLFALNNAWDKDANFYAFQKVYEGPFRFDVFYDSLDDGDVTAGSRLDSQALSAGLQASSTLYSSRFDTTFQLASKGFPPAQVEFAKALTSNMMGGLGYFYGPSIVDRYFRHEYDEEDEEDEDDEDDSPVMGGIGGAASSSKGGKRQPRPETTEPKELFTATPSRSFFPRGFYWDEGFHLLHVGAWDNDISLDILRSWINLIDENGWVGREQILGEEARSKVPAEFQTQYPAYANPPTLAMAVTAFIHRVNAQHVDGNANAATPEDPFASGHGAAADALDGPAALLASLSPASSAESLGSVHVASPAMAKAFLADIYPKLRTHYAWFRSTQRGQIREWGRRVTGGRTEAYRWRGRSNDHVLTSGLDDYPRATPPHVGELHVDLMSWMAFFSRTMREIAEYIGEEEDRREYEKNEKAILTNLDELHWSDEEQMYCDLSVDEWDESIHVCHQGYISIFPFLLGLLKPDSPHLEAILKAVRDPEQLWSNYGIRSLSKAHPLFGQGENYWRGPVWIPLNYLALKSLYTIYAKEAGPHQQLAAQIYDELRTNIISNTFREYERTGYSWEQYDSVTGEGRRSHPFTGWTSLVALIMAEQYA